MYVRMKDESQWIKIPDHHPAIISKELFDQVQAQRPRFKCPKKNARAYPLRGKVFCGCCGHAMPRTAKKNATFYCRYTQVNESAPCHGLTVTEAELEGMLYEVLSKQAQVILMPGGWMFSLRNRLSTINRLKTIWTKRECCMNSSF